MIIKNTFCEASKLQRRALKPAGNNARGKIHRCTVGNIVDCRIRAGNGTACRGLPARLQQRNIVGIFVVQPTAASSTSHRTAVQYGVAPRAPTSLHSGYESTGRPPTRNSPPLTLRESRPVRPISIELAYPRPELGSPQTRPY